MSLSPTFRPAAPHGSMEGQGRSLLAWAADTLDRLVIAPLALRLERMRLRDELAGLDHRELKDIGISHIDSFVANWSPKA